MGTRERLVELTAAAVTAVKKPSAPYTGQPMQPGVLYRVLNPSIRNLAFICMIAGNDR